MQSSQIERETGVPSWIDDTEMAEYVRVVPGNQEGTWSSRIGKITKL